MYIVGYPRSGNTWLCYLVSYCLNTEYDDFDNPGVHARGNIRKFLDGTLPHQSYRDKLGMVLKTHHFKFDNLDSTPIIYLVRDGRDVMVSYYHYKEYYFKKTKQTIFKRGNLSLNLLKGELKELLLNLNIYKRFHFSKFLREHTIEWVRHVKTGIQNNPVAIVHYEELKNSPEKTLSDLMVKLGINVEIEVIQKAVNLFDFNSQSKRQIGVENKESFFRKGIVGDWQNYFTARDYAYFQEQASDVLSELGYDTTLMNMVDIKPLV